jgi:hypothetical protein
MKEDKPYGEIRHEAKLAYMKDPIGFAQDKLIKQIDGYEEIVKGIEDLTDSYKYAIQGIKDKIKAYFSDELQMDETPMGALKRNQIRKELLEFAQR